MLDIHLIREKPDEVKAALARIGEDGRVDEILALDARRREMIAEIEKMRGERNLVSKEIPDIKDKNEREQKIAAMRALGNRLAAREEEARQLDEEFEWAMLHTPNMPSGDTPDGAGEADNIVIGEYGNKPEFEFIPRPHWEIGENLGLIDFERGTKISGSRFYLLKGNLALLQRALISFMLDVHTKEHGFTEIYPPFMVRKSCLYGTGQLPKFDDTVYRDAEEDFYWVPTAEVPVTNMYAHEIFDAARLPVLHVAYTPCFRREKMSAGKDVRGIKRGHQFDKVEMVAFTKPENSAAMLEQIMVFAEDILQRLELPWRRLRICAGDLSFTAAAKYDLEVWADGCGEWLEVSSISNFRDFQARRCDIRFRTSPEAKPEFVHTLNGSGLALPRVLIAILENYQLSNGRVRVPDALRPWMGGVYFLG
ncbi:MAG: serine--tRNA ligase [Spirochaetota bacterium]|jgi:seryl-tRNA synthetase|nr:serine--tRNA ligase [Spirochaetota bacterium]